MTTLHRLPSSFRPQRPVDERGAAMAEYALLLSGIAAVVFVAVGLFGGRLSTVFAGFFP